MARVRLAAGASRRPWRERRRLKPDLRQRSRNRGHAFTGVAEWPLQELLAKHGLNAGSPYRWDLGTGELVVEGVHLPLVTVGTVSGDSFRWAWATDAIPASAKRGLERVREFGEEHGLQLLCTARVGGGLAQGKECLAIAGRVLDAAGVWIDSIETGHIVFVLHHAS